MLLQVMSPLLAVSLSLFFCAPSSKSQSPEMVERMPLYSIAKPENIPFIIVGTVVESASPAGDFHPARFDEKVRTRRYRVRVEIENVLQGKLRPGSVIDIFFYRGPKFWYERPAILIPNWLPRYILSPTGLR